MPESRLRALVRSRAQGCCEYCRSQEHYATQPFSVDHVVPLLKRGDDGPDNLALACQGCNNHKFTRVEYIDPVTGEIAALFHPRNQSWSDHFVWSHDFTRVLGLTPTGRATVEALHLNRAGLVNLRRILFETGEHPPPEMSGGA
jgi:HNH endonuclease